jgi:hypothetical protein
VPICSTSGIEPTTNPCVRGLYIAEHSDSIYRLVHQLDIVARHDRDDIGRSEQPIGAHCPGDDR